MRSASGPQRLTLALACALALGGCPDRPPHKAPKPSALPAPSVQPTRLPLPELKPDSRETILGRAISGALPRYHLLKRPLDDAVSVPAFDEFIKALDRAKLYLLRGDVEALKQRGLTRMDDQLSAGNLRLARQGAAMLQTRRKEASTTIAELLAKPFDFSKREVVETDPDKLSFAQDQKQLRDAWRKLLKLQILQRIVRMEKLSEARKKSKLKPAKKPAKARPQKPLPKTFKAREAKARKDLATTYSARAKRWNTPEPLLPATRFIQSIAAAYDPHTSYLPPATKENFDIEMSGSLEGIGAALSEKDHFIVVRYLVPGGASWRQKKLEAGDVILAVAQDGEEAVDVEDMPLSDVVKMIRGPKDTVVSLTVKKPDDRVEVIAITRDVVVIEEGYARGLVLELKGEKTGYIDLPSFYGDMRSLSKVQSSRNATGDVRAILEVLQKSGIRSVILDLRGNGGGLLNHATGISGLFIDRGPVVQASSGDGEANEVHRDDDPGVAFDGRVIVLVDRFSASASEIVAGALQDYGRALIVGTGPTHGKGTVQVLLNLDRFKGASKPLGVLKITTQQYFRVNGDSTQVRGVIPDVLLPDPSAYFESRERHRDHAIAWSKTSPLEYKPWTKEQWNKSELIAKSKERASQDKVFAKLEARVNLLRKRDKDTAFPLQLEAWRGRRKRDEKSLKAVDPQLDKLKPRFAAKALVYRKDSTPRDDPRLKKDEQKRLMLLRRDPWIHEALRLLADMRSAN